MREAVDFILVLMMAGVTVAVWAVVIGLIFVAYKNTKGSGND